MCVCVCVFGSVKRKGESNEINKRLLVIQISDEISGDVGSNWNMT